MKKDIKRNSIVFVKNPFPGSAGSHIMQGDHYAVVCQNNMGNRYSDSVIICLSGRGDKDVAAIARYRGRDIHE